VGKRAKLLLCEQAITPVNPCFWTRKASEIWLSGAHAAGLCAPHHDPTIDSRPHNNTRRGGDWRPCACSRTWPPDLAQCGSPSGNTNSINCVCTSLHGVIPRAGDVLDEVRVAALAGFARLITHLVGMPLNASRTVFVPQHGRFADAEPYFSGRQYGIEARTCQRTQQLFSV